MVSGLGKYNRKSEGEERTQKAKVFQDRLIFVPTLIENLFVRLDKNMIQIWVTLLNLTYMIFVCFNKLVCSGEFLFRQARADAWKRGVTLWESGVRSGIESIRDLLSRS